MSTRAQAFMVVLAGLVWAISGALSNGEVRVIKFAAASILLAIALVLHEMSRWGRM